MKKTIMKNRLSVDRWSGTLFYGGCTATITLGGGAMATDIGAVMDGVPYTAGEANYLPTSKADYRDGFLFDSLEPVLYHSRSKSSMSEQKP